MVHGGGCDIPVKTPLWFMIQENEHRDNECAGLKLRTEAGRKKSHSIELVMEFRAFLSVCLFFFLSFSHRSRCGWLDSVKMRGSLLRLKSDGFPVRLDPTRVTQLSWTPRAFLYKGFLTGEECDHLNQLAEGKLEKSMVADYESGESIESEGRTSSDMSLKEAQDEVVAGIEARIATWTFLPVENGEDMQILHYAYGQKYEPHFDYFYDEVNQEQGGHRVATVLMYLSDVEKGGETVFPNSEAKLGQLKDDSWSDCTRSGYAVKPRKGDALLFFSLHPNATTDQSSLHGSCPVIEGETWSANKWIHVGSMNELVLHNADGGCVDDNPNCAQ
ncbi:Probable prolyl 4-hydroxylase 7 [Ancistrocladus abbreviatus]